MTSLLSLARPEALPLLGLVVLLGAVAVWSEIRRRRALVAFAGRGADLSSISAARRRLKTGLVLVALAVSIVALAGPYVDVVERNVTQSGVDLVVALDVSQSMAVRDVEPDRLRAGKEFIQRLGDELTQSRVSLVIFAGEGVERYPATADPKVLGQALDSIGAGFRPAKGGSSLRVGVDSALKAFEEDARASGRAKAIVLVTDGEDLTGESPDVAALTAANVRVFTIGVGTPAGGPIPQYDRNTVFSGYLKGANGAEIRSRLQEEGLKRLAEATNGKHWRLTSGFGVVGELRSELQRLDATQLGDVSGGEVPNDAYQIPLAIAVAVLIAETVISDRRRMPRPRELRTPSRRPRLRVRVPLLGRSSTTALLLAAAVLTSSCAEIGASEADRLYAEGQHEAALERYVALLKERPDQPELRVNAGNALHMLGRHEEALLEYAHAIRVGPADVRAVAHYQRGNTLYRLGRLEEARDAWKDALRIDAADRDAKFNIEIVDELLREQVLQEQQLQQGGPQGNPNQPQQGQQGQQGTPGSPVPGMSQQPNSSPQPGEGELQMQGPQSSGPPRTSSERGAPSLSDVLQAFRSSLSAEEALRLLDALLADQRGIEILLEQQQQRPRQDPTY